MAKKSSFAKFNKSVPKNTGYEDTKTIGGKKKPVKKGK
jgi:hypothetical protein